MAKDKPIPDWIKEAAQQEVPHYPERTPAVVLLDETTYSVGPGGQAVTHVRKVVKILRSSGREEAIPHVVYDKDSKVNYLHVWSIDRSGHEYTAKDNEIADIGLQESFELYSSTRARVMMNPPGADPGGVVAWEYEYQERPYLAEKTWVFQDDIPRLKESFTLALPPGYTHTTSWAHHMPDKGIDMEHQQWRWQMDKVPAIDLDRVSLAPSSSALAGRMTVHYAAPGLTSAQEGTWQGVGLYFDGLAHDRLQSTPEIAARAQQLVAGKSDFYEKAEAIGEFTQQQIRYVAIELGIGGDQPHAAADIFRNKYGDCKDKSTLLSAMLSSVGIHSTLVMVHSQRGVIDPDAPSTYGNHMIAAIEIPKGYESKKLRSVVTAQTGRRYLIFDPTWEHTPFGQLENNLQGSFGLLMEGKDSQIIQLPVLDPSLNSIRRAASFQLLGDGSLKGTVTETRFGDLAETRRYVFTHDDAEKQRQYMDRLTARDFSNFTLSDLKAENVAALNKDLNTSFSLNAANYATVAGPLIMIRPRILGTYGFPIDRESRKLPVDLKETMTGADEFDIALPDGYIVDELPQPIKLDVGFATYESSTELRGRSLHYSRRFLLKEIMLPADKYGQLQHLASVIEADEQGKAVLRKAQ